MYSYACVYITDYGTCKECILYIRLYVYITIHIYCNSNTAAGCFWLVPPPSYLARPLTYF